MLVIFFFLIGSFSNAQNNLVPNGSFENISTCPTGTIYTTTLLFASPWQNPTQSTPDLFSSCDTTIPQFEICPVNSTPCNSRGYQVPHSGNNYAGAVFLGFPDPYNGYAREYIQVKLLDSLKNSKKYCVSFYTSRAESSTYATSRIGCLITDTAIKNTTQNYLYAAPQIENPYGNFISDTINWINIKGIYTAGGGEKIISIGNFYSDVNTDTLFIEGREHKNEIVT